MASSERRELTFQRVTVREGGTGWVLVGEGADEAETLFANSLSVHGWELSLDGSMMLRSDSGVRVEIRDGHADLRK